MPPFLCDLIPVLLNNRDSIPGCATAVLGMQAHLLQSLGSYGTQGNLPWVPTVVYVGYQIKCQLSSYRPIETILASFNLLVAPPLLQQGFRALAARVRSLVPNLHVFSGVAFSKGRMKARSNLLIIMSICHRNPLPIVGYCCKSTM